MGDGGPVYVDEEGFRVGADGIIYDNEDGALDQIQIVVPDNYDSLEFYDNGTYGAGAGVELSQVYPTVYQGKLEQSGVNLNNEMTRAMGVSVLRKGPDHHRPDESENSQRDWKAVGGNHR